MENERSHIIAELLRRFTQGETLSEEDSALLSQWRSEHERNEELFVRLQNPQKLGEALCEISRTDTEAQLQNFNQRVRRHQRIKQLYRVAAVAAVVLAVLSAGLYFLMPVDTTIAEQLRLTSEYGGDIPPASNKATLTLSDGKVVELREDQKGVIADERGISYEDGKNIDEITDMPYATLTTPRGGQYSITLSDGTKVSLNAASSVTYPLHFRGNQRRVELKGEGYFEVSHNAGQPFIVRTQQQEIKVLGTVFNINAYTTKETTTLVSGRVSVSDNMTQKQITLQPNTQAIVNKGIITTKKVDADDYTGWKQGRFRAELITLRNLVQDIERWYDVQFIYPANYNNTEKAFISINRNEKLSKVLKTLELTYGVHFRIQGKEVYIR